MPEIEGSRFLLQKNVLSFTIQFPYLHPPEMAGEKMMVTSQPYQRNNPLLLINNQ